MASNRRERGRQGGLQRTALIAFAALLVLLFVGFAVAQGIGHPSVSDGDVAVIEEAPEGLGTVTEDDLKHAVEQAAGTAGVKVPKPGDPQYDELQETALGEMIERIWLQGEAEEMGITVTPKEVSDELKKLIDQAFESNVQYERFLKEAHFTPADVEERIKVQVLSEKLQERVSEGAATPSDEEIEESYEASKASRYTEPETRDARAVLYKDKAEAEKAKAELEKDDSVATWKRLAAKSDNTSTRQTGGLLTSVTDGGLPEPLNAAVFAAPPSQIEGPLKGSRGYTVFAVEKVVTEKVKPLAEVESQISNQLKGQLQQAASTRFARNYGSKWRSRTFCASEFANQRCDNFKGSGRPPGAPSACYEANPRGAAPRACPAAVQQLAPALPGTVDVLTPEGEKLAQRPQPAGLEAAGGGPAGEEVIPPPGE